MSKPIKIIYGAAAIADRSAEETQNFYDTLIKHNVHDLDTASLYVSCHFSYQVPW